MRSRGRAYASITVVIVLLCGLVSPAMAGSYADRMHSAADLAKQGEYRQARELYQSVLSTEGLPSRIRTAVTDVITALNRLIALEQAPDSQATRAYDRDVLADHTMASLPSPETEKTANRSAAEWKAFIREHPNNLDGYFNFAQAATREKHYHDAVYAYQYLLEQHPGLQRVKLDLALLYITMHRYAKAEQLLQEVQAQQPPDNVRKRITLLREKLAEKLKRHSFQGSASVGFHYDTNGNAISDSDRIVVLDTIFDLPASSQANADSQLAASTSMTHGYRMDSLLGYDGVGATWYSNGTLYRAEQVELDELDIFLASVKTGPTLEWYDHNFKLSLNGGYNHIRLHDEAYLNTILTEVSGHYQFNDRTGINSSAGYEWNRYVNTPASTTNKDRTGGAYQWKFGSSYALGEHDLVNGSITWRKENTEREYYDNYKIGATGGYIHVFDNGIFTNLTGGYRHARYDGPDLLISATRREDHEMTTGASVSKTLPYQIIGTLGYNYKNVDSNILNYDYDNHRISTTFGVKF